MPVTNNDQNRKTEKYSTSTVRKDGHRSRSCSNSMANRTKNFTPRKLEDCQSNSTSFSLHGTASNDENRKSRNGLTQGLTLPPLNLPRKRLFLKDVEIKMNTQNSTDRNSSSSEENEELFIDNGVEKTAENYFESAIDKSSVFKIEIRNHVSVNSSKRSGFPSSDITLSTNNSKFDLPTSMSKGYVVGPEGDSKFLKTFKPQVTSTDFSKFASNEVKMDDQVKNNAAKGSNANILNNAVNNSEDLERKLKMSKNTSLVASQLSNAMHTDDFLRIAEDLRNKMKTILCKLELISQNTEDIGQEYSNLCARFLFSACQYQYLLNQILTIALTINKTNFCDKNGTSTMITAIIGEFPLYINILSELNEKLVNQSGNHENFMKLANYVLNLAENLTQFFTRIDQLGNGPGKLSTNVRKITLHESENWQNEYDYLEDEACPSVAAKLNAKDWKFFDFFTPHIRDAVQAVNLSIDEFLTEFETIGIILIKSRIRQKILAKSKSVVIATQKLTSLGESLCGCLLNSVDLARDLEHFFYELLCSELKHFVVVVRVAAMSDFLEVETIGHTFATLLKISYAINDLSVFMDKCVEK